MNMGDLNSGDQLLKLGDAYATAISQYFKDVDVLFGPAYKGIPLACAAAMQYKVRFGGKAPKYCADRKEAKDHGDVGTLLGAKLKPGDRIVIVEDVTTSGKSISEVVPKIKAAQPEAQIVGLVVSFDRLERGTSPNKTALEEIAELYGIETHAVVSIKDVLRVQASRGLLTKKIAICFRDYYSKYGVEGVDVIPTPC